MKTSSEITQKSICTVSKKEEKLLEKVICSALNVWSVVCVCFKTDSLMFITRYVCGEDFRGGLKSWWQSF